MYKLTIVSIRYWFASSFRVKYCIKNISSSTVTSVRGFVFD